MFIIVHMKLYPGGKHQEEFNINKSHVQMLFHFFFAWIFNVLLHSFQFSQVKKLNKEIIHKTTCAKIKTIEKGELVLVRNKC